MIIGRCSQATTLQMYMILALNCLSMAYSLSVLYLSGVKYGDTQMLLSGVVIAVLFLCLSQAQPLDKLSSERPAKTVFTAGFMVSLMSQFALHLALLFSTMNLALSHMDPYVINIFNYN